MSTISMGIRLLIPIAQNGLGPISSFIHTDCPKLVPRHGVKPRQASVKQVKALIPFHFIVSSSKGE